MRYNSSRRIAAILRKNFLTLLLAAVSGFIPDFASAGGMIRVKDGAKEYEGKVIGLTKTRCSLMDRQGQLVHLKVRNLKDFEKIAPNYQPHSTSSFRQELRKEFPGYEVVATSRYLVCGPKGRAGRYAKLFESVYRDVDQFFRVRRFRVHAPEVPLVAVVFKTQKEFAQYCLRDKVPPSPTLMGYYSLMTNRVALFDNSNSVAATAPSSFDQKQTRSYSAIAASAGIAAQTASTIIHETTHQVGYNIGVHSRLGGTPTWVVEGLATVLEPDAMRTASGRQLQSERLNAERSYWFRERHGPTRKMGNLALLVASDDFFHRNTLDSYSESWAFTFFLLENPSRRQKFVTYLHTVGKRDPTKTYSAKERLIDFKSAFGDISRLEVEFIRYMDRL